jgi:hypothetical protein
MRGQRFWIVDGRRLPHAARLDDLSLDAERSRFEHEGGVRVTTGLLGTEVKWSAFSPCFASLFHVMGWLPEATGPYLLRFYLCGWFEEKFDRVGDAINRIEEVISKSELRITRKAFVVEADAKARELPPMIKATWQKDVVIPDISIDCIVDPHTRKYRVNRVGPNSTIAKFWGVIPATYPFVNGGSYDEIVCAPYKDVLDTGKSRYDHVLAAMRMQNNSVHWLTYQRVIMRKNMDNGVPTVTIVTELAPVDINII